MVSDFVNVKNQVYEIYNVQQMKLAACLVIYQWGSLAHMV